MGGSLSSKGSDSVMGNVEVNKKIGKQFGDKFEPSDQTKKVIFLR